MKHSQYILISILLSFVLVTTSYAQRIEGRLVGARPNFSIELRATTPYTAQNGIVPQATPINFYLEVINPVSPTLAVSYDPLNFGTVEQSASGGNIIYGFVAGVANLNLTTLTSSFTSYLDFTYSGEGQEIDFVYGQINLNTNSVDENQLDIVSTAILLPVELVNFTAEAQSNTTTMLTWQTATELNNDYFQIEHSTDGINFRTIGKERGAGTTNEVQNYEFLHRQPALGTNYYRLKQVDFDGTFEYSQIRAVLFDGDRSEITIFKLFPNPSKDYLMILPPGNKKTPWDANVFDLQGRLMSSFVISDDFYRLDTTEWPAGMYHIQLKNGTRSDQLRFVKD